MSTVSLEVQEPELQSAADRRRYERAGLIVRVDYATVDELFSEFTQDVNQGGLQIETNSPREPGTTVTMQFHLPGGDGVVRTSGLVVWARSPSDEAPGAMGIEFEGLSPADRSRINELVRALRAERS